VPTEEFYIILFINLPISVALINICCLNWLLVYNINNMIILCCHVTENDRLAANSSVFRRTLGLISGCACIGPFGMCHEY
jgi:hypothetical protein